MMLNKTCSKSCTAVNDRKLEKQSKRALEAFDDVMKRREQVKNHVALSRAKETDKREPIVERVTKSVKQLVEPKKLFLRKLIVERVLRAYGYRKQQYHDSSHEDF